MSSQPSQLEQTKVTISSTTSTLAQTLQPTSPNYNPDQDPANFSKDAHGNILKKGDYKDQLNSAAFPEEKTEGMLEKVASYIPGLSGMTSEKDTEGKEETGAPPKRPENDVQVEQFLRKQYHSRSGDGMPDPDKANN